MKVNKQFVQEVANGKYSDYDTRGEMKRAAQRILDNRLVTEFAKYSRFHLEGKSWHVMDVYDAFVDFALHGTAVTVCHPDEKDRVYRFNGMTVEECLEKMNDWVWEIHQTKGNQWLESCDFQVEGKPEKYHLSLANFHYCFAKGRISEKQLLGFCRVA